MRMGKYIFSSIDNTPVAAYTVLCGVYAQLPVQCTLIIKLISVGGLTVENKSFENAVLPTGGGTALLHVKEHSHARTRHDFLGTQ
jgi:hypothetical protein